MSWLGNLLKGTKPGAENLQAWIPLDTCELYSKNESVKDSNIRIPTSQSPWEPLG